MLKERKVQDDDAKKEELRLPSIDELKQRKSKKISMMKDRKSHDDDGKQELIRYIMDELQPRSMKPHISADDEAKYNDYDPEQFDWGMDPLHEDKKLYNKYRKLKNLIYRQTLLKSLTFDDQKADKLPSLFMQEEAEEKEGVHGK